MKDTASLALIALCSIPDIGPQKVKMLISQVQCPSQVFELSKAKLLTISGIGIKSAEAIIKGKSFLTTAQDILDQNKALGIQTITYQSDAYPSRFKDIKDAPLVIHYVGNASLNHPKTIAIVGTRKASKYGLDVTKQLVKDLAPYNCQIISGLAFGIDIAAHKAALHHNIPTIGVMANGMDRIYPSQHIHIAEEMKIQGGLLTENKLGTKPDAPLFPARNRIIAALADAVIVVEATKKGGASITAEIANSYYKDVFAVPGSIYDSSSEGCNHLIKSNKAQLLSTVNDIEYFLNWEKEQSNTKEALQQQHKINMSLFSKEEQMIIRCLQETSYTINELSWKTSLPIHQLASHLLNLEFQHTITQLPGKVFKLNISL